MPQTESIQILTFLFLNQTLCRDYSFESTICHRIFGEKLKNNYDLILLHRNGLEKKRRRPR